MILEENKELEEDNDQSEPETSRHLVQDKETRVVSLTGSYPSPNPTNPV